MITEMLKDLNENWI